MYGADVTHNYLTPNGFPRGLDEKYFDAQLSCIAFGGPRSTSDTKLEAHGHQTRGQTSRVSPAMRKIWLAALLLLASMVFFLGGVLGSLGFLACRALVHLPAEEVFLSYHLGKVTSPSHRCRSWCPSYSYGVLTSMFPEAVFEAAVGSSA